MKSKFLERLQFYFQLIIQVIILVPVLFFGPKACIDYSNNIAELVIPAVELICLYTATAMEMGCYIYRYEIVFFINKFLQFEASESKF